MNEIQNDINNETLIKLEVLQKEYDVLLQQYEEAVNNYIATLQSNIVNPATEVATSSNVVALKGRTWWGTQGLAEGGVDTQEQCEALCASVKNCTGATFNPVKRYCWARGGESKLTPGLDDDYALIPQQKAALTEMKGLNERLIALNIEIMTMMQTMEPQMQAQKEEKTINYTNLNTSYQKLLDQKVEMEKQLEEYNSAEQDYENQNLYATQQNISYRNWFIIMLIVVLVTLKKMYGAGSASINMIFWLFMFCLLFNLTFNLGQPTGFITWAFLFMVIVLMRTGYLPSL